VSRPALIAALLLVASPAHADEPPPEDPARARARVLLGAGNELQDAGDHLGALELYRQAYAAFPSPKLEIAMGTSLWNLGRFTEAAAAFEHALASGELDEALAARLRTNLDELATFYAVLTITVDATDVATASVVVDGARVPLDAAGVATVRVDPGAHAILVEAVGSPPWTQTVEVERGARVPIGVDLEPLPEVAPRVIERVVIEAPVLPGTAGRLGASAQIVVDLAGPGAAVAIGPTWGATGWLDVGGGVIGGGHLGAWAGGTAYARPGRVRPSVSIAALVFASDGAEPGVRAAAGLEWRATDRLGVTLQLGVEHYPWVPDDFVTTLWAPAVGVVGRR
jgi:hypothetical protein